MPKTAHTPFHRSFNRTNKTRKNHHTGKVGILFLTDKGAEWLKSPKKKFGLGIFFLGYLVPTKNYQKFFLISMLFLLSNGVCFPRHIGKISHFDAKRAKTNFFHQKSAIFIQNGQFWRNFHFALKIFWWLNDILQSNRYFYAFEMFGIKKYFSHECSWECIFVGTYICLLMFPFSFSALKCLELIGSLFFSPKKSPISTSNDP